MTKPERVRLDVGTYRDAEPPFPLREDEPLLTLVMPIPVTTLAWLAQRLSEALHDTGFDAFLEQPDQQTKLLNVNLRRQSKAVS